MCLACENEYWLCREVGSEWFGRDKDMRREVQRWTTLSQDYGKYETGAGW